MTTPQRWLAEYDSPTGEQFWRYVEMWHPATGEAMVVDEKAGGICPARSMPGFRKLYKQTAEGSRCIGVIPGQGWSLILSDGEHAYEEPVIGWAVTEGHRAWPIARYPVHNRVTVLDESLRADGTEGNVGWIELLPPSDG